MARANGPKRSEGKCIILAPGQIQMGSSSVTLKLKMIYWLEASQNPRKVFTIRDLANYFLTAKERLLDSQEIVARTFNYYHRICGRKTGWKPVLRWATVHGSPPIHRRFCVFCRLSLLGCEFISSAAISTASGDDFLFSSLEGGFP